MREGFDISYKICADRDWMMKMQKKGYLFKAVSYTICYYSLNENSVSISQKDLCSHEAARCIKNNFPRGYVIYCLFEFCRSNKLLKKCCMEYIVYCL